MITVETLEASYKDAVKIISFLKKLRKPKIVIKKIEVETFCSKLNANWVIAV